MALAPTEALTGTLQPRSAAAGSRRVLCPPPMSPSALRVRLHLNYPLLVHQGRWSFEKLGCRSCLESRSGFQRKVLERIRGAGRGAEQGRGLRMRFHVAPGASP